MATPHFPFSRLLLAALWAGLLADKNKANTARDDDNADDPATEEEEDDVFPWLKTVLSLMKEDDVFPWTKEAASRSVSSSRLLLADEPATADDDPNDPATEEEEDDVFPWMKTVFSLMKEDDVFPLTKEAAARSVSFFCFFPRAVKYAPGAVALFAPNAQWMALPSTSSL